MAFFSSKTIVLTGYGFVLSCMHVLDLALLGHSMPDYTYSSRILTVKHGQSRVLHCAEESHTR